jgi:hypothetical protein
LRRLRHGKSGSENAGKNRYAHVNRVYRNLCYRGATSDSRAHGRCTFTRASASPE